MRILFVTPYPLSRIRIRSYGFVTHLARQHEVMTLALCAGKREVEDAEEARRAGISIMVVRDSRIVQLLRSLLAWGTRQPLQVAFAASSALRQAIQNILAAGGFDILHIESVRALGSLPDELSLPTVWDAVDCISRLYELGARAGATLMMRAIGAREAERIRRFEGRQLDRFSQVLVTSERERQDLLSVAREYGCTRTAPLHVLPHGVDRDYFRPYHGPRQPDLLIFSGKMSFHANIAGAIYLIKQILPRIWSQRPTVRLLIAGAYPSCELWRLACDPRITLTGYVADLRPYIARALVAVCPLPYAVGIQNKALEAMALGTPLVASSCVASGLSAVVGRDLLVADEPADFANAVLRLLEERALREQLAHQGLTYINTYHDWDHIIQKLTTIYRTAIAV